MPEALIDAVEAKCRFPEEFNSTTPDGVRMTPASSMLLAVRIRLPPASVGNVVPERSVVGAPITRFPVAAMVVPGALVTP